MWRTYDIDVITFCGVRALHRRKTIDLLSIDMEGLDADVVEAYPFVDYRPRVIVAEWNNEGTKSRLLSHFTMCGYTGRRTRLQHHCGFWLTRCSRIGGKICPYNT